MSEEMVRDLVSRDVLRDIEDYRKRKQPLRVTNTTTTIIEEYFLDIERFLADNREDYLNPYHVRRALSEVREALCSSTCEPLVYSSSDLTPEVVQFLRDEISTWGPK